MPRYHFHAARQEHEELEPLTLTLSGETADGSSLPEFVEEFPPVMPAAVQLIMLEAALDAEDDDGWGGEPDERARARMGFDALRQVVGRERMRKWMRAGYTTQHLFELMTVLVYYWTRGHFPNPQSARRGADQIESRPRRTSAKRAQSGLAS